MTLEKPERIANKFKGEFADLQSLSELARARYG